MYWIYATIAAGLVAAWLFDRRARRNGHRVSLVACIIRCPCTTRWPCCRYRLLGR